MELARKHWGDRVTIYVDANGSYTAAKAGMTVVNLNTETGPVAAKIPHFASAIPNMGPYMEYAWAGDLKPESWYSPHCKVTNGMLKVPEGPGFGIEYDPDYLKKAVIVEG